MSLEKRHLMENKARKERWRHLTEGIKSNNDRIVVENLLDNTKEYAESLREDTTTASFPAFTTYAFPLIRRIMPSLIANQLVAVQPMTMPTGLVFYLDFKYGRTTAPTVLGDRIDAQAYGMSSVSPRGKFNPYYGMGARGEVPTGAIDGSNTRFTAKNANIKNPVLKVNSVATELAGFVASTGECSVSAAPTSVSSVTLDYDFIWEGRTVNPYDASPELQGINMEISQDTVTAEQIRLHAKWTLEGQQDMMAYHGINVESELTAVLADEIKREIDRMIVNDIYNNVGFNTDWHKVYDPGTGDPGEGLTKKEYDETLFHAINDVATQIYKKRLVQPNWIVASPEECARLEKINSFRYAGDMSGGDIQKGINLFGTILNKYKVFCDPMCPANKYFIGYKGTGFFDTGYIYCPYIPIYTTPTITDIDFKPRKAIMSRFGRKLISNDFYGSVTLI